MAPTDSQSNRSGSPGRRMRFIAASRSLPSSLRDALRIRASVCSASVRMRASFGTASSTDAAPVAKVR